MYVVQALPVSFQQGCGNLGQYELATPPRVCVSGLSHYQLVGNCT